LVKNITNAKDKAIKYVVALNVRKKQTTDNNKKTFNNNSRRLPSWILYIINIIDGITSSTKKEPKLDGSFESPDKRKKEGSV